MKSDQKLSPKDTLSQLLKNVQTILKNKSFIDTHSIYIPYLADAIKTSKDAIAKSDEEKIKKNLDNIIIAI